MQRVCLTLVLGVCGIGLTAEYRQSFEGNAGDLETTGDVAFDAGKSATEGSGSLRIGPRGKVVKTFRPEDGSGRVELKIFEDGTVAANPKKRGHGALWGIGQKDGRVLVVGAVYAPYLSGDRTYASGNYLPAKKEQPYFLCQYLALRRQVGWHHWVFDFDAQKGLTIQQDGKPVKRFNWNRTKQDGFTGIVFFGDHTPGGKQQLWVDDIRVVLGPPMAAKPTPPPPPPPATPKKDPMPEKTVRLVEKYRDVHPRLLFDRDDIPRLKAFAQTPEGKEAMAKVSDYVKVCKAPDHNNFLKDATDGQRQGLWRMPTAGLHYLLTGDAASKAKCLGFMKKLLAMDHWETGREQDAGMSSANICIGAALLYDWLYDELDPEFREKYRDKLLLMARRQYHRGHLNKAKSNGYWQGDPQNNHRWHRNAGLSLCVLAAAEEDKDDDEWILAKLKEDMDYVAKWLPEDGTYHEGHTYLMFGGTHLMLACQAVDRCLGTEYRKHPFFRNVPKFLLSCAAPGFARTFYYGDNRGGYGGYANFLKACCVLNQDKNDYAGIMELDRKHPKSFWLGWLDLIWSDSAMAGGSWEDMPKVCFWPDVGVLHLRDNWDASGVGAMFKCGPLGGYTLNRFRNENKFKYINVAHDDFDANSFVLFAGGEMVAETDGYSYQTRSANHNTVLVNGVGQMVVGRWREGYKYNQPGRGDMTGMAVVTTLKHDGPVVIIEGEAAKSYPATRQGPKRPNLERFRRSFIWVEGKYVLILDDLKAPGAADYTWLVQAEQLTEKDRANGIWNLAKKGANCDFQLVADQSFEATIGESPADHRGKKLGWQQLQAKAKAPRVRFASVYNPWQLRKLQVTLTPAGESKAEVTITGPDFTDTWTWQPPTEQLTPSRLSGEVGGKTVEVTAEDKAPNEAVGLEG